jgi:hypothetical protein
VFTILQTFIKDFATGSENSLALAITGITAGSLIVVGAKWESQPTGEMTVQDTTNSQNLTVPTESRSGDISGTVSQMAYYKAPSSGSITIQVTAPGAGAFIRFIVAEISTPTFWALDVGKGANGTSTAPSTGNFTTNGIDEIVCAFFGESNTGTLSNPLINGQARDGGVNIGAAGVDVFWWKSFSSPFTGAASATRSVSEQWAMSALAFKAFPPQYGTINRKASFKIRAMKAGSL